MEKRILLKIETTNLKNNRVAVTNTVMKKITLQNWLTDEIKEISDIVLTKQEINKFVSEFLQYTPNINQIVTNYYKYEFFTEEVNLIN